MKFFITGCGRSGTYLMTSLFECFENMEVVIAEMGIKKFLEIEQKKEHITSKRKARFYNEKSVEVAKKHDVKLINMIRDGRDVVTSKMIVDGRHIKKRDGYPYWIKPERWIKEVTGSIEFQAYISMEIRYEELVSKPDEIQEKIMKNFGLKKKMNFTEYTQIFSSSIGRGKEKYKKLEIPDKFYNILEQKGYK